MKAYWMNTEVRTEEKKTAATDFNQITATPIQRAAIAKLQEHIFGSTDAYIAYRDSKRDFPKYYRRFKNFILLCNEEFCNEEFFNNLIALCPKCIVNITGTKTKASEDKEGTHLEGVSAETDFAKFVKVGVKGTRAKGRAKDPTLPKTYVHNVDNAQWRARASGYNEEFVKLVAERYTKNYNEKFGTNFAVHYSKKRIKK